MAELRFNPFLGTWTMSASNRQKRPHLPGDWCPFCPGEGKKVPAQFDVLKYDNDFPVLTQNPDAPDPVATDLYKTAENYGKCEVILYTSNHNQAIWELTTEHLVKLTNLWSDRFTELAKDPKIRYIYEFENRGREVGATIDHPHGQLYAFSFVPQKIELELINCQKHFMRTARCLVCDVNAEEAAFKKRVVIENEDFIAYIPFFTDYPYGVYIASKRHFGAFPEMRDSEKPRFAEILKGVAGAFDQLFNKPFPYMMCIHQTPVNSPDYGDAGDYYHFHIEFYPPMRAADRLKFYAGSEMGAGAAANPLCVEETAENLREAYLRFVKLQGGMK